MKLKCISSLDVDTSNPSFIKGNRYEVINMTNDGRYYVATENGTYIDVPLKGSLWEFVIIDCKQEQEDIIFEIESLIKQLNHEFDKLKNLME